MNIYPPRSRPALEQHPEIYDVAVFGIRPRNGAGRARDHRPSPGSSLTKERSPRSRGEHLASYKLRGRWTSPAKLRAPASGKILKRQLRAALLGRPQPPRSANGRAQTGRSLTALAGTPRAPPSPVRHLRVIRSPQHVWPARSAAPYPAPSAPPASRPSRPGRPHGTLRSASNPNVTRPKAPPREYPKRPPGASPMTTDVVIGPLDGGPADLASPCAACPSPR